MILFVDGHHGIYVPQLFAQQVKRDYVKDVEQGEWDILEAGPDHEHYWEVWADVLDRATVVDGDKVYRLHQDQDLFLATEDDLEDLYDHD